MVDAELVAEFLVECRESQEVLDVALLELEGGATDAVSVAFRAMHGIKGAAGFMEAGPLERLAHAAENVLSAIRDGKVSATAERASTLLEASDAIRGYLDRLTDGARLDEASPGLLRQLADDAAPAASTPMAPSTPPPPSTPLPPSASSPAATQAPRGVTALCPVATGEPAPSPRVDGPAAGASPPSRSEEPNRSPESPRTDSESVRVDVGVLDDLMNLVGELVVCRNQIVRVSDNVESDLQNGIHRLDGLTTAIQERVMKTRMRPVGAAWGRLPRLVRDLAASCGKSCTLVMEGDDVELDRSVLEHIKDPLTHMLRNAIDHGVEAPAERRAAGKPEASTLLLRAAHAGGQVHIDLVDDGKGLDVDAIRAKAVSRGLLSAEAAQAMPDEQAFQLVFEPGFSTAATVTNLSGRGVGMDVVRTNLAKIGGSVDLHSTRGKGTRVRLRIPLTLAILPALIVKIGGRHFAIPQAHLVGLVDLTTGANAIEDLAGAPVLRRRGELLSLVYVDQALGLEPRAAGREYVVVVQADDSLCGLVVDDVEDTEEIVVKPLGDELDGVTCFSGATVRGDGSIALILDVVDLARQARADHPASAPPARAPTTSVLRFEVDGVGLGAVPVRDVVRIEDVEPSRIQRHGGRCFLPFEGGVLPLRDLIGLASGGRDVVSVVVCAWGAARVGVIVSAVLEVVDADLSGATPAVDEWSGGMAYVADHVTAVLDVQRLVAA
jgi:two-component system chemotaxis sensor kinase CheA